MDIRKAINIVLESDDKPYAPWMSGPGTGRDKTITDSPAEGEEEEDGEDGEKTVASGITKTFAKGKVKPFSYLKQK